MSLRGFQVVDGKILYDMSYKKFQERLIETERAAMAGLRVNPGEEAAKTPPNWTSYLGHPLLKNLAQKLSRENPGKKVDETPKPEDLNAEEFN